MSDAYSLLNIDLNALKDFPIQANRVGSIQTMRTIRQNIRKLKEIEGRLFTNEELKVSKQSIEEVICKVRKSARSGVINMDDWTMRELRIVSYYMMKLQGDNDVYNYALSLLEKGWRNMFFNGLVFYVLNSWNLIKPELRKKTCRLLTDKLTGYTDNNRKYVILKNYANFFEEAGPARMATLLVSKKLDVREAPQIIGHKPSSFAQSFYSDVIVKYYEKVEASIEILEEVFEVHNDLRTKKLLFANLVEQADKSGDVFRQTQLSRFINRILGDITLTSTWAPFPGATLDEALKLKHAMQLVNMWFTRRIIETFFEVCVQDLERKNFWLDYVQYVSKFKIVGSTLTKRALQNDPRTNIMFLRHFIETNSVSSQTSALVLCMKNKVIVEFSDTGALYVYNQEHSQVKFLRTGARFMSSTSNLKIPSMNMLVETDWGYNYFNEEGRMTHQGYWQDRLSDWMQRKIVNSTASYSSYLDTKDDKIFVATALPEEEVIEEPIQKAENRPDKISASATQLDLFSTVSPVNRQSSPQESRPASKPSVQTFQALSETTVKYETGIKFLLASKWVFNGSCRVICNSHGYYINIFKGQRFVHIGSLREGATTNGNIWIKKEYGGTGWHEVVHSLSDREVTIGYIKQGGGGLMFKQKLSQYNIMHIKL